MTPRSTRSGARSCAETAKESVRINASADCNRRNIFDVEDNRECREREAWQANRVSGTGSIPTSPNSREKVLERGVESPAMPDKNSGMAGNAGTYDKRRRRKIASTGRIPPIKTNVDGSGTADELLETLTLSSWSKPGSCRPKKVSVSEPVPTRPETEKSW